MVFVRVLFLIKVSVRKKARQETAPISGREGEETSVSIATGPDEVAYGETEANKADTCT